MITEYGKGNEILFAKTYLGTYRPNVEEVLMLHVSTIKEQMEETLDSTKILIEDDPEVQLGGGKDMFKSFREFVLKSMKHETKLGKGTHVHDLLLPNWCRIHNAFNS